MTFRVTLQLAHKGKGNLPQEMKPVEILKETGMSLTEQRKQPDWFIELLLLDIKTKRAVENAAIRKANRSRK